MLTEAVEQVVRHVESRIAAGEFPAGTPLPAERDLAAALGVSRATVRSAARELIARGLVRQKPHYRPTVVGRLSPPGVSPSRPGTSAARTVVFISFHDLDRPDMVAIYRGAAAALAQERYWLAFAFIAPGGWEGAVETERNELERAARDPDVAGVILWYRDGREKNLPALRALRASTRPLIFVDRAPPPGFDADFVGTDNRGAAASVVRHLLERGHRRIAHVTYDETTSTVVQRGDGYRLALAEYRVPYRPEWVVPIVYDNGAYRPQIEDLVRSWHAAGDDGPTAVFAVNDTVAWLLVQAARAGGLRVPEDLAVAGFDGADDGTASGSFLTTAVQPMEQIGWEAAYLLRERLAYPGPPHGFRHILLQAPLLIRGSTVSLSAQRK